MDNYEEERTTVDVLKNKVIESQAILEQSRWVYAVIDSRIESFNQRAGILLAANFAVIALGAQFVITNLVGSVQLIAILTFIPLLISAGFSVATIVTRTMHDIGSYAVLSRLTSGHVPTGNDGSSIHEHLLNMIIQGPTKDEPSALIAVESLSEKKANLLTYATWIFVSAFAFPLMAASVALVEGLSNA